METAKEFVERLPWMSINGKPDFDQWENHLKHRDALLRADERQKAAGWISVKEQLPEENHAVLIYYDKHMIEAMFFDGDWGLPNGDWIMGHTVSHWMPLPPPPAIMAEPEEGTK